MKHNIRVTSVLPFSAANNPVPRELIQGNDPGAVLTKLRAFAKGTLNITGGTANGTSFGKNPGRLCLDHVDLDLNPKSASTPGGKVVHLSTETILNRRIFDRGYAMGDPNGAVNGAAGAYTIQSAFEVPRVLPKAKRPFDTALPLDYFNSARLTLYNGSRDNQFSGNDRVFDYTQMQWYIEEFREYPGVKTVNGKTVPLTPSMLYDDDRPYNIKAAQQNTGLQDELPNVSGTYFLDLLFQTLSSNNLVDTILNNVRVFTGSEMFIDRPGWAVRSDQTKYVTDQAQSQTGLYKVDIAQDGGMMGAVAPLSLVLDLSDPSAGNDVLLIGARRVAALQ